MVTRFDAEAHFEDWLGQGAEFFIVMPPNELRAQPGLAHRLVNYPITASTDDYRVYDLRRH